MKKKFVAELLSDFFKPQKNHDLLYTGDVQQFFKTRHSSNICFVDDPAADNGSPTGNEDNPSESSSVLGSVDAPDGDEPENQDDNEQDNKEGEDDPDGDKDPNKEKEDENKKTGAPEKYELSIPEGMELDEKALEKFEPLFREANMTNEQASKFAEAYGEHVKGLVDSAIESLQDDWTKQNKGWQDSLLKDAEFGGAEFKENMNIARTVLDRFGGTKEEMAEVREALNKTGAGNHPAIVRLLFRVGKAMQDDKIHDNGTDGSNKKKADLYPNSPNMKD